MLERLKRFILPIPGKYDEANEVIRKELELHEGSTLTRAAWGGPRDPEEDEAYRLYELSRRQEEVGMLMAMRALAKAGRIK